ncbi:hypothetical protein [Streptomyces graminofaciens]|nr:hypothetical protein [Streptomyces graminofaciens]
MAGLLTMTGPAVGGAEAAASVASSCAGRKVRTLTFAGGTVRVHKRGRHVCAVLTPRKRAPGKGGKKGTKNGYKGASVSVRAWGGRPAVNPLSPVGPVTVHAGRRCVWIEARVGTETYSSGWILR